MARKADVKGGNGDVVFNAETGTARKYLRNTSTAEKVSRFKRELAVFQELCKNPVSNIVEVTDVHINEEKISESYVEMKKYDGSLYDILQGTKGNVKLSLELILPVIRALYTLSEGNPPLYHRDIKPDNILFLKKDDGYTLYLTDFGTCFLNDGSERLTPETMAVGPRMYIAPEYETGRVDEVTEKGDIFSIGKVIWCMINGEPDDFMPSNFWFIDEYDLTKRYPSNPDMIKANTIIASCLNIDPKERSSYPMLIAQIQGFIENYKMNATEEMKLKVTQYQEKRRIELLEIKEKNRLLINCFSRHYIDALENLLTLYPSFELIQILYTGYQKKSKDGVDYTSTNVDKNTAHYLYSETYDRIYFSINYNPASGEERYCNITISYHISTIKVSNSIKFQYSDNGAIICEFNGSTELLSTKIMTEILNSIVMEYIA